MRRIAKAHKIKPGDIHVCYEAGGCGMWIARHFEKIGVPCTVVAPSLIPSQSGDKVKTDPPSPRLRRPGKKDARKLARLLRAGELTAVRVPDETDEAIRDLCRARVDAHDDLRRARTRVLALLRRLGIHYPGKTHWTGMHWRFLRNLKLEFPAHRVILEEGLLQIEQLLERIERYDSHMELLCESWANKPVVEALMTSRGFKTVAAMMVVSEKHRRPVGVLGAA